MIYDWGCKPGSRRLATGHGSWIFNASIFPNPFVFQFFCPFFFLATHGNTCRKTNFIGSVTCWLSSFRSHQSTGAVPIALLALCAFVLLAAARFAVTQVPRWVVSSIRGTGTPWGTFLSHLFSRAPVLRLAMWTHQQGLPTFVPPKKNLKISWRFEVQYHENLWVRTWSLPVMSLVDGKIADWNRICCHLLQ